MNHPLYDLVSIGNPLYDTISNSQMSFSPDALSGGSFTVCLTADALGVTRLVMIGSVPDTERDNVFSTIEDTHIEHFLLQPELESTTGEIIQDGSCEGTIIGPQGTIRIRDIPEEFLLSNTIVLNPVLQEMDIDFVEWISSSSEAFILLDFQGFVRKINDRGFVPYSLEESDVRSILNSVDLAKANQIEAQYLTGEDDPFVAVETVVEWGAEIGLVTMGIEGSIVYDGNEFLQIPAFETNIACSLSAGDIFLGAYTTKLLETDNLLTCGLFATSVTSILLENEAALPLSIDHAEIQKRVDLLSDEVKIL